MDVSAETQVAANSTLSVAPRPRSLSHRTAPSITSILFFKLDKPRPVESIHSPDVARDDEVRSEDRPVHHGRRWKFGQIGCHLVEHITASEQLPAIDRRKFEDGSRSAGRSPAGSKHHTRIQEYSHCPALNRRISASSASIHSWSCREKNTRGGFGGGRTRSLVGRTPTGTS